MSLSFFSRPTTAPSRAAVLAAALALVFGTSLTGCNDLAGNQSLPPGTQDPSYYNNATGAIGMRNAAMISFVTELPDYVVTTGLLTDELADPTTVLAYSSFASGVRNPVDERLLPELSYGTPTGYSSDATYDVLQQVRATLSQAIGQLAVSDTSVKDRTILTPAVDSVWRAELYALYGYSEVMLADLFCSGVPLSTLDFHQDFTYRAGSPTAQVYQDAIAKFDTAIALSADSIRIQYLARIGKGRAQLDLGQFAAAADDVSGISGDYQYQLSAGWYVPNGGFQSACNKNWNYLIQRAVLGNNEGENGLPYSTSGDPRTATIPDSVCSNINTGGSVAVVGFPRVYSAGVNGGYAPVTIASGVEARLIEAEAALHAGGAGVTAWLTILNDLRQTAPIPGTTVPDPDALPQLTDPGIGSGNPDSARIALTFRERAAWLYVTGHRQGDLRRQLREYGQYWFDPSSVYPSGAYTGVGPGYYGTDVTAPIPGAEYLNPLFHGCLNRAP